MSKTRVYELAKELGLDNKELIARLEKIGIAVKSHSSTIEEGDVERIRRELMSSETGELVEKRIKSTVIRRRVVHVPGEEALPKDSEETSGAEAEVVASEEMPAKETVGLEAEPGGEALLEKERRGKTAQKTEAEPVPPVKKAVPEPPGKDARMQPAAVARKKEDKTAGPIEIAAKKLEQKAEEPVPPEPVEKRPPVPPPAETKVIPPKVEAVKTVAPPAPAEPEAKPKKEIPRKPELKIVKEAVPPKEEKPAKAEAEKPKPKGAKRVQIQMEEPVPVRKKAFIKSLVERRDLREDREEDGRPRKWRDEKKAAVVRMKKTVITVPKASKRRIKVGEAISVADLAKKMGVKASEVINKLMGLGLMVNINQSIDLDAATLIASEFGYQVEASVSDFSDTVQLTPYPEKDLQPRAPVVTIMGHVDHGKTSLLDAIRHTNVIEGESGGITQAIGAYHVHIKDRDIVFLDTPGHEAFTAMRARGAQVTDIVVLVVAADDGVMDQTVEAINHARVAGVPIIVAVNKIDKPEADPEKIRRALADHDLVSEQWGGETIFCEVSAKKKIGIEELLELILLQADMMELKADPNSPARGVVIEAKLDRGRGPVATILIQEGTLREGDSFVSRTEYGKVRALINDKGQRVKEAGPSMPVEVIGFSGVSQVSAEFVVVEDEKKARSIGEYWIRKERERELSISTKITLEQLYQKMKEGVKELNVIIKADVQGSSEALIEALNRLSTAEIKLKIIHSSTGAVTETDVMLASASNAVIIGFKVKTDSRVMEIAEQEGVEIKAYDIIYKAIADVKAAMEGLLEPKYQEVVQGRAEVRQIFKVPKVGTIAGSYVTDGKITRNSSLKLLREGMVVHDGRLASLKRMKDDVREVASGFECGIGMESYNDIQVGDIIEAYISERVERRLQ
ncbi:MAG: translation initiation factor IF-2 [Deltaproteobacteria bacterium]|nr:translation initiation factor IF-2 [Deltaproteobacteria bacterium]